MGSRSTDEISEFDMRQFVLLEEATLRLRQELGRAGAREQALREVPLVFDMPVLDAAARSGDRMLASQLAVILGGVSKRGDWPGRRESFAGPVREAHLAEARRRVAERAVEAS